MFSNCAGRHRKRDVTTVFTYSHLNTPIDKLKRAYYLKYFIKWNVSSIFFYFYIFFIKKEIDDKNLVKIPVQRRESGLY